MPSFQQICERMHHSPLQGAENDNSKVKAIKNGLKTRTSTKEKSTFWEDFIQVCGDAESLSHLLGVSKYDIAGWPSRIKKYLHVVRDEMDNDDSRKGRKKNVMVNTGDKEPEKVLNQPDASHPNPFMGS